MALEGKRLGRFLVHRLGYYRHDTEMLSGPAACELSAVYDTRRPERTQSPQSHNPTAVRPGNRKLSFRVRLKTLFRRESRVELFLTLDRS